MDAKTLATLRGSIAKWEAIVAGTGEDKGIENCPLCKLFYSAVDNNTHRCKGCPVEEKTGQTHCDGSPYEQWSELATEEDSYEARELAQAELDFLRSLLPPDELS